MQSYGLVYGMRYDGSWYGPCGHTHADARRIARNPIGRRQRSGAVLYPRRADGDLAVWIPGCLRPGAHYADVDAWLDPEPY
jgi:hypothetical protein